MALTTLNHFDSLLDRDMGRFLDRWMGNHFPVTRNSYPSALSSALSLDMKDTGNEYEVKVDLPGVERENISVTVENGLLNIAAERQDTREKDEKGRYYFSERSYGSVSRSVKLPANASDENVKAKYEDGVLTLYLRKDERSRRKAINIQ